MQTAILATSLVFLLLAFFIIVFVIYHKFKQRKSSEEKTLLQTQFSQTLLQTQLEIQEQTLTNISQEIHDNIGQILSLAKLHLNTLQPLQNPQQQQQVIDTKNLVSKAIVDLRNLSRSMYGHHLQEIGLVQAVTNELTILQNTGQFLTEVIAQGEPYKIPPQKEIVLFRIIQEALNNCIKHAKAGNIKIQIDYTATDLKIVITDNGQGFDSTQLQANKKGLGLQNMQNRANLIGAICTIESFKGKGTTIFISLPNSTT